MDVSWTILGILLLFPALLAGALVWIQIQDARVKSWQQASGRIVSSQAVARTVRRERHRTGGTSGHTDFITDETIETRNFADVAYEFVVAGKTFRGTRIDLSVDRGNVEVAETLRRYPAGKSVTVFYDPADPAQCILERDDPKNLRNGWLAVALLIVLIVGGAFGINRVADVVRGAIGDPRRTPLVVVLGLFAVVAALFARMVGLGARQMRGWTRTEGRVVQSAVEKTFRTHDKPSSWQGETTETIYVPRIVYRYTAGGTSFDGDNIGGTWSGPTPATAETYVTRFPLGTSVAVFFNPANPTESTLDPSTGYLRMILWAIAALFAMASFAAARISGEYLSP
jgi:hypothetical protein